MSTTPTVYHSDIHPRRGLASGWERLRNKREVHWAIECFAEMLGVFLYVYLGVGSTAAWVIGNILKESGLSSIFQIGFGYTIGILFALIVCSSTSGGHFNPCMSICFSLFRGFPPLKALRYIVAQILGAYIACLLVYHQYHVLITECEQALIHAGVYAKTQFTPNGLAGIFGIYMLPGANTIPRIILNEFVNCIVIGLVIWAAMDPSNVHIPPVLGPVVVSFAYGACIWGFAVPGVSLNTARDLGGRLFAMTIWGREAAGGSYAAIAALVNIPATIIAVLLYEAFLTDSDRVVPAAQLEFLRVHTKHRRHAAHTEQETDSNSAQSIKEKSTIEHHEVAKV